MRNNAFNVFAKFQSTESGRAYIKTNICPKKPLSKNEVSATMAMLAELISMLCFLKAVWNTYLTAKGILHFLQLQVRSNKSGTSSPFYWKFQATSPLKLFHAIKHIYLCKLLSILSATEPTPSFLPWSLFLRLLFGHTCVLFKPST